VTVDPSFRLRAGESGALVTGTPGNVLTFQSDGSVAGEPSAPGGGLQSFNGRTDPDVVPQAGDYDAAMVGAADVAQLPQTTHSRVVFFGQVNSSSGTEGPIAPGATVQVHLNDPDVPPFVDAMENAAVMVQTVGDPGPHTMVVMGASVNDAGQILAWMINAGTAPDEWTNIPFRCWYETMVAT
jgi:hypothetical protein